MLLGIVQKINAYLSDYILVFLLIGVGPVSYTHLDVYKRQGLNCPVSMELMVFRDTPTSSASWVWERFFSARATFSRFFRIN